MKFCKQLLGVNKNASNNACRGELGRLPVRTKAVFRSLKFWINLTYSPTPKLSCLTLQDSQSNIHSTFWCHKIKTLLFKIGYGNIWLSIEQANPNLNEKELLNKIKIRLTDIAKQNWLANLHDDNRKNSTQQNKLRTYRLFKTTNSLEQYLITIPNITDRRLMTKLRISDHSLEIEKGRHKKPYKSPQDRLCPFCKTSTEDEKHFLVKCNLYDNLRQKLTTDLKQRTNLDLDHLSEQNKFTTLINPPQKAQSMVAKYIKECFQLREEKCKLVKG